jgi:hypothetical protein
MVCPDLGLVPFANGSPYYMSSVTYYEEGYWGNVYEFQRSVQRYDGNRKPDSYTYYFVLTEDKGKRKDHILKELKKRLENDGYTQNTNESYAASGYTTFEKADKFVKFDNEFEANYLNNQQYLKVEFGVNRNSNK